VKPPVLGVSYSVPLKVLSSPLESEQGSARRSWPGLCFVPHLLFLCLWQTSLINH
jgi:hypothetical protein